MKNGLKTLVKSLRLVVGVALALSCVPLICQTPYENGIHVGEPKIYDSRALTLMLDDLANSLKKNTSFIDPKALAAALGNLQGFNGQDVSQAFSAYGAVGPNGASVFSGAAASGASGAAGTPNVSITVSPTLNAGSPSTAAPAANATPPGPAASALPTLQTAPSFTPNFGENAGDLLSDEVNLTYQYTNVRMMLDRSLTDRISGDKPRLQAVVGFDIDIEPIEAAKDAAATVEVTVNLADCGAASAACDKSQGLSLVSIMPEEGSHNAATLSQKADAFGGAIAAQVFSAGYAYQKRSQVFYLYRDMDTVSFQKPQDNKKTDNKNTIVFGWQFRPVLGRHSVAAGTRHMLAVLALPAQDLPPDPPKDPEQAPPTAAPPKLNVSVVTRWTRYDSSSQTTDRRLGFWASLFTRELPKDWTKDYPGVNVFTTAGTQHDLTPTVAGVQWVRTGNSGVAIVKGTNFFPETAVRLADKQYATAADGLVIKSDQQLEVIAPLAAALGRGVLSGRYGEAQPLEAPPPGIRDNGFTVVGLSVLPSGAESYQLIATLKFFKNIKDQDLRKNANAPIISIGGTPLTSPFFYQQQDPKQPDTLRLTTFVAASLVKSGLAVTVTYPFHGPTWTSSMLYYAATAKVARLGGKENTRLLISTTDPTMIICDQRDRKDINHQEWHLQLDKNKDWVPDPKGPLACPDPGVELFQFDIATTELKPYRHFVLLEATGKYPPLVGDIPAADPPPPGPSIDKDQNISVPQNAVKSVTFKGKNLDQVTKILFGAKTEIKGFKASDDGKSIVIPLDQTETGKPSDDIELQLISDGNDPVAAPMKVTAAPAAPKGK